jgi:hypothetical protein
MTPTCLLVLPPEHSLVVLESLLHGGGTRARRGHREGTRKQCRWKTNAGRDESRQLQLWHLPEERHGGTRLRIYLKSILEERREERWYVWYRTIDEEERKKEELLLRGGSHLFHLMTIRYSSLFSILYSHFPLPVAEIAGVVDNSYHQDSLGYCLYYCPSFSHAVQIHSSRSSRSFLAPQNARYLRTFSLHDSVNIPLSTKQPRLHLILIENV